MTKASIVSLSIGISRYIRLALMDLQRWHMLTIVAGRNFFNYYFYCAIVLKSRAVII